MKIIQCKVGGGQNSLLFGRTLSKEVREKLSIFNKNNKRSKHKQETINKISLALTGSKNPKSKKVYLCLSKNPLILHKEFDSYTSAGQYLNCHSSIGRHIVKDKLFKKKWILRSKLLDKDS